MNRPLALASVAVALAAADTYVVVLVLPDMMASVGLAVDQLQRAAPVVSGFLLGYVAMLPLIGRLADVRGRLPVLVACLLVLALGSLVTGAAYDLPAMVAGRLLQGLGAGGLVPATLALVADGYPAERRGLPLGVVGAVQELGSVLGPLYAAVVLAVAPWQAIFGVNLLVALLLAAALSATSPLSTTSLLSATSPLSAEESPGQPFWRRVAETVTPRRDPFGLLLLLAGVAALVLTMAAPPPLTADVTLGLAFVPLAGDSRWLSPLGLVTVALGAGLVARCLTSRRPLVDLRGWTAAAREADLPGATLLALALGGVVLAFASADPEVSLLSPAGPWLLAGSALCALLLWRHTRTAPAPLVPRGALAARAATGALLVSLFAGAALVAALVDVPLFARVTVDPGSQVAAALVLVRFLVALPAGALLGGWLVRRVPARWLTAAGMLLATGGFWWMSTWGLQSLAHPSSTVPLVGAGLGFGLAIAPVNVSLLASTASPVHGVASALLVVARMVGMLVGISALTTIGLRRYYAVQAALPAPADVCASGTQCASYTRLLKLAGLEQLQTVFVGAAVCAAVAAVLGAVLLVPTGMRTTASGTLPS